MSPSPMQGHLFNYDFGAPVKRQLRISALLEILRRSRVLEPVPSRSTVIALCEDGTLDAHLTNFGYLITEDSFQAWVRSLNPVD